MCWSHVDSASRTAKGECRGMFGPPWSRWSGWCIKCKSTQQLDWHVAWPALSQERPGCYSPWQQANVPGGEPWG